MRTRSFTAHNRHRLRCKKQHTIKPIGRLPLRWLVISVLILLTGMLSFYEITVSFSSTPDAHVSTQQYDTSVPLSSTSNLAWKQNTLTLLEKTHLWNGSYSGDFAAVTGLFDPYTTYYALLTYQTLGATAPTTNSTITALKNAQGRDGHFFCERVAPGGDFSTVDQVKCLFYLTLSLQILGSAPENPAAIIATINNLQATNGLYASNPSQFAELDREPTITHLAPFLLTTREAITVLHALGASVRNRERLHTWLLTHWLQGAPAQLDMIDKVAYLANIAESLAMLEPDGQVLPQTATPLAWIKNACQEAATLKGAEQPTNLFFLRDCLNLEQLILRPVQPNTLLPSSFFSTLTSFQQTSGGFNAFFLSQPNQPDIQGTYLFAWLFQKSQRPIPRADDILRLLNRQSLEHGGFFPVFEVPTVDIIDTSLSLRTLALLGARMTATDTVLLRSQVEPLLQSAVHPIASVETMYNAFALGKELELDTTELTWSIRQRAATFMQQIPENRPLSKAQLYDAYYLSLLVKFNGPVAKKLCDDIILMQKESGGLGVNEVATLQETWQAVSIIEHLAPDELLPVQRQHIIAWVLWQQTTSGGFTEAGQTNVYSSYAAIECLALLGGTLSSTPLASWLRSLESHYGGIIPYEHSESGPTLIATYEALMLAQQLHIIL